MENTIDSRNFISLKPGSDETCVMYTRSDNEEFMSGDDTNEIIKSLFESTIIISIKQVYIEVDHT